MASAGKTPGKRFLDQFLELVDSFDRCDEVDLQNTIHLKSEKVRVPAPSVPLQILLGGEMGKRLFLYPEPRFEEDGSTCVTESYLLFDPDQYFTSIGGFIRVAPGDALTLGRDDPDQAELLIYPKQVAKRHLSIKLSVKKLKFADRSLEEQGSCIAPLVSEPETRRLVDLRFDNISRLTRLIPMPLQMLEKVEALELLNDVVDSMASDSHQSMDSKGRPGGLVILPDETKTVFLGDLHARIDNLLVVLTQNHFLDELEKGTAMLVILGDAVHPDEVGVEHEMESSILIMDLILILMKLFPGRVYYLRGNHDSFCEEIGKRGVPQGVLWEKKLLEVRGPEYLASMGRFYESLPYVALSGNFIACHAGAPTSKISREKLINIREHPKLESQIVSIRPQKTKALSGYNGSDVKRMRKQLALDPDTPFLVGHTPISNDDTMWLNTSKIPNHHILFGANLDWVGVIIQMEERLLPLRYPVEPMLVVINQTVENIQHP